MSHSVARSAADTETTEVRRTVVLDTSVLVDDPEAPWAFPGCDVVVPLVVVEELDGLKSRSDDTGRAAREALRNIEEMRCEAGGDIRAPFELDSGATFRVEPNGVHLDSLREFGLDPTKADNRILAASTGERIRLAEQIRTAVPVELVSNDTALRIKANQVGLTAGEHHRVSARDRSKPGWSEVLASSADIDAVYSQGSIAIDDGSGELIDSLATADVAENEFAVLKHGSQSVICRRTEGTLQKVRDLQAWDLKGRSKEQRMALDLLLDPSVKVVGLEGGAGTGKTILALAAGLEQVSNNRVYDQVLVFRPVIPVGDADLGFLPGTAEEKLDPWFAAIIDTIIALTADRDERTAQSIIEELTARRQLQHLSVGHVRGRTFANSFVIVDEAQNLAALTLKTLVSRIGENAKVVLTGDVAQIDQPYLSERTNALAILRDRFRGQRLFGGLKLTAVERSDVAELAGRLL